MEMPAQLYTLCSVSPASDPQCSFVVSINFPTVIGNPSRAGRCRLSRFMDLEKSSTAIPSCRLSHHRGYQVCRLSMNGCQGDPTVSVSTTETLTFPMVPSPSSAMNTLNVAISALKSNPPAYSSGIIRLQVPIKEQIEALDWLHAQRNLLPRCFFSGRSLTDGSDLLLTNGNARTTVHTMLSVAGVGSAVFFRRLHQFSYSDWKSIKRFLSTECPLIRAYGAIRFDASARISSEWENFGAFYFIIPQMLTHRLSLMS